MTARSTPPVKRGWPPINSDPRRVRPPYDVDDRTFDHLRRTDTDTWRVAIHLDRVAALGEPLDGLPVSDYEHRVLEWAAGLDVSTVAVLAALLHRTRAAS
ncbi:MAG: hypothetical protein ACRDRH_09025 [Pseudonocardia sp.]